MLKMDILSVWYWYYRVTYQTAIGIIPKSLKSIEQLHKLTKKELSVMNEQTKPDYRKLVFQQDKGYFMITFGGLYKENIKKEGVTIQGSRNQSKWILLTYL